MAGKKFGRLAVIQFSHLDSRRNTVWDCVCDCGARRKVRGYVLRSGETQSCGCLHHEQLGQRARTHGLKGSGVYRSYTAAKSRCENPHDVNYARYGGRGIKFQFENVEQFYKILGDRPEGHTLDRINWDANYSPTNCRWATPLEQARNRSLRFSRLLTQVKALLAYIEDTEPADSKLRELSDAINATGFTRYKSFAKGKT